jgi:hypothetical protein
MTWKKVKIKKHQRELGRRILILVQALEWPISGDKIKPSKHNTNQNTMFHFMLTCKNKSIL